VRRVSSGGRGPRKGGGSAGAGRGTDSLLQWICSALQRSAKPIALVSAYLTHQLEHRRTVGPKRPWTSFEQHRALLPVVVFQLKPVGLDPPAKPRSCFEQGDARGQRKPSREMEGSGQAGDPSAEDHYVFGGMHDRLQSAWSSYLVMDVAVKQSCSTLDSSRSSTSSGSVRRRHLTLQSRSPPYQAKFPFLVWTATLFRRYIS